MKTKPNRSFLEDLINKRRSIRKYKPEEPPKEWIESMLHGGLAPALARFRQPVSRRVIWQAYEIH